MDAGGKVVDLGSCAVSLMLVADGRLGGYVENCVAGFWDCAAGIALCNVAGQRAEFSINQDGTIRVVVNDITNSGQK